MGDEVRRQRRPPSRTWPTALLVLALAGAGCATSQTFRQGEQAALAGDWDQAVEHFQTAVQEDPGNAEARIALERAMQNAAAHHATRAQDFEAANDLPAALTLDVSANPDYVAWVQAQVEKGS